MTESNRIEFKRELTRDGGKNGGLKLTDRQSEILKLVSKNSKITAKEVADALGVTSRTIQTDFSKLLEIGVLERVGSDKNGEWKSLIS